MTATDRDWAAQAKAGMNGKGDSTEDQAEIDRRYLELRGQLLDVAGLRNLTPPQPLVAGYLFKDTLAWFSGSPGHGKSFGAVDVACCVATGTAWHGHWVAQGPVLYLIAEGASGLSQRVDAWEAAHDCKITGVTFLPVPVQIGKPDTVDVAAFTMLLQDIQPVLVIIDTQARVTVGCEENSNKDMGMFVHVLETLRTRTGATILIVHHTPRNGDNLRGAVALEGAATSIIHFAKNDDDVELTNQKQKDAPEQPPLALTLSPMGDSAVLTRDEAELTGPTPAQQKMLDILHGFGPDGAPKTEYRKACADIPDGQYYRERNRLLERGWMREQKKGSSTIYREPVEAPEWAQ